MPTDPRPTSRRKILLDADVGIDDAIAMLFLAGRPDVDIVGVGSVHGNIPSELAAANARRLLELCGLDDVPVAIGARRPMAQPLATAEWVHGADGLGNTNRPAPRRGPTGEDAVAQMLRLTREAPGEIDIVAVGPLTNLGLALCIDPSLAGRVRSVTVMGGTIIHEGNASATGEANIWHDPEAAQLVFSAPWPATMVGLDVTQVTRLRSAELAEETGLRHDRIILSAKVSNVRDLVDVYRLLATRSDYPLHLGLTEAGMGTKGVVASTAGLAILLLDGAERFPRLQVELVLQLILQLDVFQQELVIVAGHEPARLPRLVGAEGTHLQRLPDFGQEGRVD